LTLPNPDAAALAPEDLVEDAPVTAQQMPRPVPRRLRVFAVYLSVLLVGGMGGGALAYGLLTNTSEPQAVESAGTESAPAKDAEESRANQEKPDEAQAGRVEAEKKLEAPLAEDAKSTAATQLKSDAAEPPPAPAAEALSKVQQNPAVHSTYGSGKRQVLKTGDCSLVAGNVAALRDCVDKFNR
jgi:hypothetical protein